MHALFLGLRRGVVVGMLLVGIVGCGSGDDGWNRQAVSGSVTLNGQPLDAGNISFEPLDLSTGTSGGTEIKEGSFTMPRTQGLPPGEYTVRIYSPDTTKAPAPVNVAEQDGVLYPQERIPSKWNAESKQTITIAPKGENQFEFAIP